MLMMYWQWGVTLSLEERSALCLPQKTSLNPILSQVEFETNVEIGFAKARYSLRDELDEEGEVEDEPEGKDKELQKKVKEVEARSRMIYDDESNVLDLAKRRVTDIPQNSKVYLPPPLPPGTEAGLAVKKQQLMSTFNTFTASHCDAKGKQISSSLSRTQQVGLASLKARSKAGDLFILEMDKTNKFAAVDRESYLLMGQKHTTKDNIITSRDAEGI